VHLLKRFVLSLILLPTVFPDRDVRSGMVTGLEILLLAVVLVALLGASTIVETVRPFIVNAVVGLLVLFLAQVLFGLQIAVTPIALVIVALGGLPGSVLIILLSLFGVAF